MFELNKISKIHLSLLNKECKYECDKFIDMKYINDSKFQKTEIISFDKFTYIQYHNIKDITNSFLTK